MKIFCSGKTRSNESYRNDDNFIIFYSFAPWCPACKSLAPIWKQVASWSQDLEFAVGEVDVTTSPGLSGRFMVTALPTIFQ